MPSSSSQCHAPTTTNAGENSLARGQVSLCWICADTTLLRVSTTPAIDTEPPSRIILATLRLWERYQMRRGKILTEIDECTQQKFTYSTLVIKFPWVWRAVQRQNDKILLPEMYTGNKFLLLLYLFPLCLRCAFWICPSEPCTLATFQGRT